MVKTKNIGAFIVNLNVNFNILKQFNCALVGQIKDLIRYMEYFFYKLTPASIVTRLKIGMLSPIEKYGSISKIGGKIRCLILKTDFVFPLPCELIPVSKVLRQEAYCCTDQTSTSPVFIFVHTQRIAAFTARKRHFICSNGLQANGIKLFALAGVPKPQAYMDKSLVFCLN